MAAPILKSIGHLVPDDILHLLTVKPFECDRRFGEFIRTLDPTGEERDEIFAATIEFLKDAEICEVVMAQIIANIFENISLSKADIDLLHLTASQSFPRYGRSRRIFRRYLATRWANYEAPAAA